MIGVFGYNAFDKYLGALISNSVYMGHEWVIISMEYHKIYTSLAIFNGKMAPPWSTNAEAI